MSTIAGSTSVRLDSTISAQALLTTSATSEIPATMPKNRKVGRACGHCEGRTEPGAGSELGRTGASATGASDEYDACKGATASGDAPDATDASDGKGASSAAASRPAVGGTGSVGSLMIRGRVPTPASAKRPACSV